MDIRHLRYFLAVAEAGSMTRAAEALGMQQPPLSQQIMALEQELGVPLLRRHPKGVELTPAGQVLRKEAQRLVAGMAALQERMARFAQGLDGVLDVAFTSSAAAHAFTPRLLRECRQRFPGIELRLSEHNAEDILDGMVAGRLHAGLLRVPVSHPPGIQMLTLLTEPAVLALPVGHPLVPDGRPRALPMTALRDEGFILVRRPGAPGLYANWLRLCEQAGFRPRIVAEVDRMMTNLNLVAAGAGVSVVPASMSGAHPDSIVYCPITDGQALSAPLTLAWRSSDADGPLARLIDLSRALVQP